MYRLAPAVLLLIAGTCPAQILEYGGREPPEAEYAHGILVTFDAGEEGRWLNQVEAHIQPSAPVPGAELSLYIIDLEGRLLREMRLPEEVLHCGETAWRSLPIAPMQVPREFGIGLVFAAQTTQQQPHRRIRRLVEYGFLLSPTQGGPRVGVYNVEESHSYIWEPGTPGQGRGTVDYAVRAFMAGDAEGDPEATDVVILNSGECFVDRVLAAEGDPLDVVTEGRGRLPQEDVALVTLGAVRTPEPVTATVRLEGGVVIEGALLSMDDTVLRVRTFGGLERTVPRADAASVEFRSFEPVPVGPQPDPVLPDPDEQAVRGRPWGEEQATGAPDTMQAGDIRTAWTTKQQNAGEEWLELTYGTAVPIAEVRVRETYNPGAVVKVTAIPERAFEIVLWEGEDPTKDAPGELVVTVDAEVTSKVIRVYLDTRLKNGWNEIDAVELVGTDETRQWAASAKASSSYAD